MHCRICSKEAPEVGVVKRSDKRKRLILEHALGYRVSETVFSSLCDECKELVTFLASSQQLPDEYDRILRGETDAQG